MLRAGALDVLHARIYIPQRGPSITRCALDSAVAPPASVVLAEDGGLSLSCTVAVGAVRQDLLRWEGVLQGGAGGLGRNVAATFQHAQLRDALNAIAQQAGEKVSSTIDQAVLGLNLIAWTVGRCPAALALDHLAGFAADALGVPVTWRPLGDGSLWIGVEGWPGATLPADAEVVDVSPDERCTEIAAVVPALLPGVNLAGVGRIVAVEHYIGPDSVRTHAWT